MAINNKLINLTTEKVRKFEQIRVRCNVNNIEISLICNQTLLNDNEYILILKGEYISEYGKIYPKSILSISKLDSYELNLENYVKKNENNKFRDDLFFKEKLFSKNIEGSGKIFWNRIYNAIENVNSRYNGNIEREYRTNIINKKGIYIQTIKMQRMTDEHKDYLISRFNLDLSYLNSLQEKGFTIKTTNDYKSALKHRGIYEQLKNNRWPIIK